MFADKRRNRLVGRREPLESSLSRAHRLEVTK
jgi:hypothetical protein